MIPNSGRGYRKMRYVNLVGVTVLACTAALAQPVPKVESFFGYSYVRFNSAGPVPAISSNGGNTQIVYNFNSRIGLVGDIGGYHANDMHGFYSDNTTFTI